MTADLYLVTGVVCDTHGKNVERGGRFRDQFVTASESTDEAIDQFDRHCADQDFDRDGAVETEVIAVDSPADVAAFIENLEEETDGFGHEPLWREE
ncbi:MAG TPA: hypothetical protein VFJ06_14075 [Halococcus sp.]|nr:hypothetical protein [Halococcus sp.]